MYKKRTIISSAWLRLPGNQLLILDLLFTFSAVLLGFFCLMVGFLLLFFSFLETRRDLSKMGFNPLGKPETNFSGSECACPPPCLRGFMELEALFRVAPEGARLQNQQELIPSGKTSAQHAQSGFQTYQWFNLIYCSPSCVAANLAELLESCLRSSPVWSCWSVLGKEAKRSSGDCSSSIYYYLMQNSTQNSCIIKDITSLISRSSRFVDRGNAGSISPLYIMFLFIYLFIASRQTPFAMATTSWQVFTSVRAHM